MNIIWKKDDQGIAITTIVDGTDAEDAALSMQANGSIPSSWECVATNYNGNMPNMMLFDAFVWGDTINAVLIDMVRARALTKERLRMERGPLLAALDIQFQRAQEDALPTTEIVAAKNKLRDVTDAVDTITDVAELLRPIAEFLV